MRFDRRNAMKTAGAGLIGWLTGGKAHAEPVGEAGGVELIAEPCGCGEVVPESVTLWVGSGRITVTNNTEGPVVVNVVLYE